MLQNLSLFQGSMLCAMDGDIGHIIDFIFEAKTWIIRYVVVETGGWLSFRKVLISRRSFVPEALGVNPNGYGQLSVNLRRQKVADSPPFDVYRPITRRYEEELHYHYGLPLYWHSPLLWRDADPEEGETAEDSDSQLSELEVGDLRSTSAYQASNIQVWDGPMGILNDFRVDSATWTIRELILDTGHWYHGKEIRVRTADVDQVPSRAPYLHLRLTREDLRNTQSHHVAHPATNI